MSRSLDPPLSKAFCPYCEHEVLVFEDPPRCPMCACPLGPSSLRPFTFPGERS